MDHSFKETGMGSSMLVNRAGANGNEEPGEQPSAGRPTTTGFTQEHGVPQEPRKPPACYNCGGPHFKTQCTPPTVEGPQARQHVNLVQGVQDMADLSIFVMSLESTRTTTAP
ncbi:hypothetical protein BV898_19757 [Hypsibius exemplaris]|uniref:Uncharacterized protein n=1 Tax=Hypsibius exemplaris TaxID=2072580 RepID=A0A9X6NM64_HYPEX|nr:hypothetical protein BV898_19757 [Hypsibius exemplaris]